MLGFSGGPAVPLILRASLSDAAMTSWGWRIPFLIGLPLGVVGLYLRTKMEDTPVFRELQSNDEVEQTATGALKELFKDYWRPILRLFLFVVALNIADYTPLTYLPTYLSAAEPDGLGISSTRADVILLIGQLIMIVLIWIAGGASDRVGRKPMFPAHVRYAGMAISYNVSTAAFDVRHPWSTTGWSPGPITAICRRST